VREIGRSENRFRSVTVHSRERNLGLASSIIQGTSQLCQQFGEVIVLEDDMLTSPNFLGFMNKALRTYEACDEVISVHGYVYPLRRPPESCFFLKGADCWGWATWARGWGLFESDAAKLYQKLKERKLLQRFNYEGTYDYEKLLLDNSKGLNDSWAVRWYASALLEGKLTLYPPRSLIHNFGLDRSGSNCGEDRSFDVELQVELPQFPAGPVAEDAAAYQEFCRFFQGRNDILARLKRFLSVALR
jgi:hypothetical protein